MALDARIQAQGYAAGRIVLGLGLVAAPARLGRPWVGSVADEPGGQAVLRALGVRDFIMGAILLHTLDHDDVGRRWARTCALADAVDAGATLAVRRSLPPTAWGVVALAAGGAVQGVVAARGLPSSSTS